MFKQIALIHWAEATADRREAITASLRGFGADRAATGIVQPGSYNGGDLVWHLHFADEAAWAASDAFERLDALEADAAIARIDAAAYVPDPLILSRPDIRTGIYRCLLLGVMDHATPEQEGDLLRELRGMSDHIPEILNAASARTVASRGTRRWTHVWEQEFAAMDGLLGPYMTAPYHWGVVDRWFDPEMPEMIVDEHLCHSASSLEESVIRDYGPFPSA